MTDAYVTRVATSIVSMTALTALAAALCLMFGERKMVAGVMLIYCMFLATNIVMTMAVAAIYGFKND